MEYLNLADVLDEDQGYILDYVRGMDAEIKAVRHPVATNNCFEKADLLGWEPEQVVKAIFLNINAKVYGFVCPELGTKESPLRFDKSLVGRILGLPMKQVKFSNGLYAPLGMENGTCTPFVLTHSMEDVGLGTDIEKIFVYDSPKFNNSLVDISIGGHGEEAHQTSLHLYGKYIYDCLKWRFNEVEYEGVIQKFSL